MEEVLVNEPVFDAVIDGVTVLDGDGVMEGVLVNEPVFDGVIDEVTVLDGD